MCLINVSYIVSGKVRNIKTEEITNAEGNRVEQTDGMTSSVEKNIADDVFLCVYVHCIYTHRWHYINSIPACAIPKATKMVAFPLSAQLYGDRSRNLLDLRSHVMELYIGDVKESDGSFVPGLSCNRFS